jgi:L-rhamnose mutarotase
MIRKAFTLRLNPGALDEYIARHEAIWPEMVEEIEKSGIRVMNAFHHDGTIFYYSEVEDEGSWDRLWSSEVHDRWAENFKPLIAFREDGTLDTGDCTEVWRLETGA